MTTAIEVDVRPATSGDRDHLADHHREATAAVVDARGGELDTLLLGRSEPIAESYVADLDRDDADVLVGTVDGVTVGHAVVSRRPLRSGECLAVVEELYVTPRARGVGVGYALMRSCVAIAREAGCRGIDARALPGDRSTKNFFESFGLVARSLVVHSALD